MGLKAPSKTQVSIALTKTEGLKEPLKSEDLKQLPKAVDQKTPSKTYVPIALSDAEGPSQPTESQKQKELYNVNLNSSRTYEATAAVNRRLQDSGYSSFIVDEIDNQGPLFRISVPNFETVSAARDFVDKVVDNLGLLDAWIERQRSKK